MTVSRNIDALAAHYSSMDERNAAQAVELVRALRDQLNQMIHQLVRLERQDVTGTNGTASAIRSQAAALRQDIDEAQILIDRLQRRYLNGDGHAPPRRLRRRAPQGRWTESGAELWSITG